MKTNTHTKRARFEIQVIGRSIINDDWTNVISMKSKTALFGEDYLTLRTQGRRNAGKVEPQGGPNGSMGHRISMPIQWTGSRTLEIRKTMQKLYRIGGLGFWGWGLGFITPDQPPKRLICYLNKLFILIINTWRIMLKTWNSRLGTEPRQLSHASWVTPNEVCPRGSLLE